MNMVDELNDNDSPWNYYQMFEKEHPKADSCEAHPELCPYTLEYKATVEDDDENPLITEVSLKHFFFKSISAKFSSVF